MMNKKAQSFTIFHFMIVAFLIVIFCAGLIYVQGLLKDTFDRVGLENEKNAGQPMYVNLTQASNQIWGKSYESIQALRLVALVYILSLGAGIIIVGFLERKHPFLFFVYILIVLLGVLFSPTISNAYENLLNSGVFGGQLATFTASNFILLNLPTIVLVVGILSSIGLFINLVRSPAENLTSGGYA